MKPSLQKPETVDFRVFAPNYSRNALAELDRYGYWLAYLDPARSDADRGTYSSTGGSMMKTLRRTVLAATVMCLALLTTAASGGPTNSEAAPPAACGAAGMPTCYYMAMAQCIVQVGPFVITVSPACDLNDEGCGPE